MYCLHCLAELKTTREWFHHCCWQCLKKVRQAVELELKCEPDYSKAWIEEGIKYIPMKEKG